MNHDIIDLTLDDKSDDGDEEDGRRNDDDPAVVAAADGAIPYAAYLPIGVDVTDDVVHIDSDSDNEVNVALADLQAHLARRRQISQQQQSKQGKFDHRAAAVRKKRKRVAELAAQKKRQRDEAERQREEAKRKRLQEEERRLQLQLQQKQAREAKRKAEARALRENPPTNVNFVIIDSDPEDEYRFKTQARPPPVASALQRSTSPDSNGSRARRFYLQKPAKSKKVGPVKKPAAAAVRESSSSLSSQSTITSPNDAKGTSLCRERTPQPYKGKGARRVEYMQRLYQTDRDFNYFKTRQDAAAEQDRLLAEAAERMRRQQPAPPPRPVVPPIFSSDSSSSGPTFAQVIPNIHERFPIHWMWKNPFACLGLPPHAPLAAAKAQYRTLVRCYHPDKSKCAGTSNKFHAVVRAFTRIREQYEGSDAV